MNRFASIATTAALAGSLIGTVSAAQATTMYLVPISDITATYAPGATVTLAAVVDLTNSSFASVSIPFATAFTSADFAFTSRNRPAVSGQPTQNDPNAFPAATVFSKNAQSYTTTASKINGNSVYTVQNTVGQLLDTDANGNTVSLAAGTYTLGTFTFPILATNTSGFATVYMPTPFGFSDSANATDGAFMVGTGALNNITGKDIKGNTFNEPVLFPDKTAVNGVNGKYSALHFKVTSSNVPAPSSLLVIAMGVLPAVGLLRRRSAK